MSAKKSSPRSIRFNVKNFEAAILKSGKESAQELVDFLLEQYCSVTIHTDNNNIKSADDFDIDTFIKYVEIMKRLNIIK